MTIIASALILFALVCAGWYWFEGRWDRELFFRTPGGISENLRPKAALELLNSRADVQVLDVRSAKEFEGGALPGAIHLSTGDPSFQERAAVLQRDKPVLVYCAGGYRSRKAVEVLRDLGFESIHHLHRGYLSWRCAGLPVRR